MSSIVVEVLVAMVCIVTFVTAMAMFLLALCLATEAIIDWWDNRGPGCKRRNLP